jgi:sec-independent protein translocase protein TatB
MFGIGPQELVIVALLALVVFGPRRLPQMARELGRFVSEARGSVEEFKEELSSEEGKKEARRHVHESEHKPVASRDRAPRHRKP